MGDTTRTRRPPNTQTFEVGWWGPTTKRHDVLDSWPTVRRSPSPSLSSLNSSSERRVTESHVWVTPRRVRPRRLEDQPIFRQAVRWARIIPLPLFFAAGTLIGIFACATAVWIATPTQQTVILTTVRQPAIGTIEGARTLVLWRPLIVPSRAPRPILTTASQLPSQREEIPCLPAPCSVFTK